ncbi:MAG TPA: type II secretion system protein [Candidatus Omnitrophota bacterium]|nr:type II secretion system protein [Candidatus Omnitrophota bacterium]
MGKRGITLLETIVTLVIMAIGASIVVPKIQQTAENKRADSAIQSLRTISHCMRLYALEKNLEVFQNTSSGSLSALEKLSTMQGGSGCFDYNALEPTYDFFANKDANSDEWISWYGTDWGNWVSLVACDKKSKRVIFLRFAGDPTRGLYYGSAIFDFKDTACPDPNSNIALPSDFKNLVRNIPE